MNKDSLDSDSNGLGRFFRDGLDSGETDKVEDVLREALESDDLQELSVGKPLQIAHVCGLAPRELADLLRED
jgi:hypothetical protein